MVRRLARHVGPRRRGSRRRGRSPPPGTRPWRAPGSPPPAAGPPARGRAGGVQAPFAPGSIARIRAKPPGPMPSSAAAQGLRDRGAVGLREPARWPSSMRARREEKKVGSGGLVRGERAVTRASATQAARPASGGRIGGGPGRDRLEGARRRGARVDSSRRWKGWLGNGIREHARLLGRGPGGRLRPPCPGGGAPFLRSRGRRAARGRRPGASAPRAAANGKTAR